MTSQQIISLARAKILETTEDIITDINIYLYLNEANKDVWKKVFTSNKIKKATIVCTNGICTLPALFGRAYGPAYDVSGNAFEELSIADYNTGNFDDGYTIDTAQLLVSNTSITSLILRYYQGPDTLTSSVNPSIDDYFHEPMIYGVIWRCQEELQDEELSTYYQGKFESEMKRKIESQSTYEETNQRGGQMFVEQNLIF